VAVKVRKWHGAALRSDPSLGLICEVDLTRCEIVATAADDSKLPFATTATNGRDGEKRLFPIWVRDDACSG